MSPLEWIVASSILMAAISLTGAGALVVGELTLRRLILPLVAFSAGTLLGGTLFHLIPESIETLGNRISVYIVCAAGFTAFFCLAQFLHWHHCHATQEEHSDHKHPVSYLILLADGLHNLLDGMAIAGSFLADERVGLAALLAAAAHEIPQELGDFGVLLHAGWSKSKALFFNLLSSLTFLVGALIVYWLARGIDTAWLLPFAAGNFLYIAAADLVPEVRRHPEIKTNVVHFLCFAGGLALMLAVRMGFEG
ncbi:MAG: ZIP family metal transporter [Bdellovibrionota bacterium]